MRFSLTPRLQPGVNDEEKTGSVLIFQGGTKLSVRSKAKNAISGPVSRRKTVIALLRNRRNVKTKSMIIALAIVLLMTAAGGISAIVFAAKFVGCKAERDLWIENAAVSLAALNFSRGLTNTIDSSSSPEYLQATKVLMDSAPREVRETFFSRYNVEIGRNENGLLQNLDILKESNVVALSRWRVDGKDLVCLVQEHRSQAGGLPVRTLTIVERQLGGIGKDLEIFRVVMDYAFVGMFPTKDAEGDLMTVWEGATAYHLEVLHCFKGKIESVLSVGASIPPEIIWSSTDRQDAVPIVLATDTKGSSTLAEWRTSVYGWNDKKYRLIRVIDYPSRFLGK